MNAPTEPMQAFNVACARKTRCENRWTAPEDKILLAQVLKANGRSICWRSVAAALPGRNNKSCRKRWIHSLNPGLRKGRWTAAEDVSLTGAVEVHGKHWFRVARMLGNGRTDDQCAKRWREALDPNIRRGPWGDHEDDKLIEMFRVYGRKWNDIAASLNGRPPVQCRNRWLSLVRAGKIEDDAAKPELDEDSFSYPVAPESEAPYPPTFEGTMGADFTPGHFRLRRTSWEDRQANVSYDESAGQLQLYPPTYPEVQYREQRVAPPTRTVDLAGTGYYPPSHTASYSPSPSAPTEGGQLIPRPVHVVAPTPVNLVIQTNFTHVEHNYYYASQESDTSSGYGSTPPPTTASSTRSSFSFSSADSQASTFDQSQELTVNRISQSHSTTHPLYLPSQYRHQYEVADGHCYQPSPLTEHETSSYHGPADTRVHPHEAHYPRGDRQYPGDCNQGYESEPESEGEWMACSIQGYGYYPNPNHATEMWRHPS